MNKKILFFLVTTGVPFSSVAGSLVCENTKVTKVAYHANNKLMVQLENMNRPVFFCNPETQWSVSGTNYVMGPETCKTVFSMFLTAKATGATITRVHFDGEHVPAKCDQWGAWNSAVIRYVNF
ncbi:hypothetical protein CWB72_09025 [Pseudoalteromonas phenolica]|uniref:hypothetical protein n=1 Tax=Pseudoalteromonas phenolica TaxID=161398 RepID=UPI00110A1082|nr:hypothetical protein [Pseudoalteromonas phenolica]TMN90064.1 hypothetical protein CWB72_09025 [Pseudoalteromonas phenolica]